MSNSLATVVQTESMTGVCARPIHRDGVDGWMRPLLVAIVLSAFALRAYHLDYQSLWSDEGISLQRSAQALPVMLQNMPAEHVPGYFVLLHVWMRVTGTSDFSLRYLSLLPSVAAVALIFRLGAEVGSPRGGQIAALLLATSAFQVWYAQEVRMYSWLLAANLGSTWAFWRLLTSESTARATPWGSWWLYVITTVLSIYLHYFGFLMPIAHILIASVWLLRFRQVRAVRRWAMAGAFIFVLFVPWIWRMLALFEFAGWREPMDPGTLPWLLLQTYTVGPTAVEPWAVWIPWVYAGLAVLGGLWWGIRAPKAAFFLIANLVIAVAIVWLAVVRNPDFHVRYTIWVSAPLMLLVGGGCVAAGAGARRALATWTGGSQIGGALVNPGGNPATVSTRCRLAGFLAWYLPRNVLAFLLAGGLVATNGFALQRLYSDASVHKPNFRAAAAQIMAEERPGDVILMDGPNPDLVFMHYYEGNAPVLDLRYLLHEENSVINAELEALTAGANRAWEVLLFHSPGPIQVWTATQAWVAQTDFYNTIRVALYGLDHAPMTSKPMAVFFGPVLELRSVETDAGPMAPGDLLRVTTKWFVHRQADAYKFSLRLIDEGGQVVLSDDYVPQNWFAPTDVWVVGQVARDQRGFVLPADMQPGRYWLTLRLYDPNNGAPVETEAGIDVQLAQVDVGRG